MFIYQVSRLKHMRVSRRIVLTLITKALYKFGCFKEKVWSFLKFWTCNAANLLSCPETILHEKDHKFITKSFRITKTTTQISVLRSSACPASLKSTYSFYVLEFYTVLAFLYNTMKFHVVCVDDLHQIFQFVHCFIP